MQLFSTRCLRVKNGNRPLSTRCKNKTIENGILCQECQEYSKTNAIYVLMHQDITKKYKIPFKNQLCVKIDLRKKVKRPERKNEKENRLRKLKNRIMKELDKLSLNKLKDIHDGLDLDIWKDITKNSKITKYALRYHVSKEILNKFLLEGYSDR